MRIHFIAVPALALFACVSPPLESPEVGGVCVPTITLKQNIKNKVDILFMIDNSPSMSPMQNELRRRFPELIKVLDEFAARGSPASYHIGVVTSDLGAAGYRLGAIGGAAQCEPGGDGGRLVAIGEAAPVTCGRLGKGLNFIDYNQIDGTNNLPPGQDLATTFGCMAAVGDKGCGYEHQLESAYRALHDPIPENAGFLRSDAILAVVFRSEERRVGKECRL